VYWVYGQRREIPLTIVFAVADCRLRFFVRGLIGTKFGYSAGQIKEKKSFSFLKDRKHPANQ